MTKLTLAARPAERGMRRDAGIDHGDADAVPVHSRNPQRSGQHVSGARLIGRRRRVRDGGQAVHAQVAREMVHDVVARQFDQFRAVREDDGSAAHPLDDLQPVTPAEQIEVAIVSADDDACAFARAARLVFSEIGGKVRSPLAPRTLEPKGGARDQGRNDDKKACGLYRPGQTI